jgi:dTMP kinase
MLITFEGLDGAGKTTQIKKLSGWLQSKGRTVEIFREPGGTAVSELIRGLLLNPELEIPATSEMLLFSAARAALVELRIKPKLAEGAVVIMDRFFDSTTAYQGFGRGVVGIEQIEALNRLAAGGLEPDLTIYLRLPVDSMDSRMDERRKDRMEQSGPLFFERVSAGYDRISQSPRFFTVDATLQVEAVADLIREKTASLGVFKNG